MMLLKMLRLDKLFTRKFQLNLPALSKEFDEEYDTYKVLKDWFKGKQIKKKSITIYSPGCGKDAGSLLLIYDAIISQKNINATFVFLDMRDFFDELIFEFKKFTKKPIIVFKNSKTRHEAKIYYKDKCFTVLYYVQDISGKFPNELKNKIDIYYERAFEMFRSSDQLFASNIYQNMASYGLLISDYGFNFGSFKNGFKKLKNIPKRFGLYKNFQIWQKISSDLNDK